MSIAERAQPNIDRVIADSLVGNGVFSAHLGEVRKKLFTVEENSNILREVKLLPEELKQSVDDQLKTYATGELKKNLEKVIKGEARAADFNQIAGMAGTVGQASSALQSGSIFSILSIIPSIMTAFGEYITAFTSWMFPGDNKDAPKSFGEALADVRASNAIPDLAKAYGVDPARLARDLMQEPVQMVELDGAFNDARVKISDDVVKAKVSLLIKTGQIKISDGGSAYATPQAVNELDGLGALPTKGIPGKEGSSWKKLESASPTP